MGEIFTVKQRGKCLLCDKFHVIKYNKYRRYLTRLLSKVHKFVTKTCFVIFFHNLLQTEKSANHCGGIYMRKMNVLLCILCFIVAFFLNILGLMKLIPLYITSPLLFIIIFVTLYLLNHRKTFRGF